MRILRKLFFSKFSIFSTFEEKWSLWGLGGAGSLSNKVFDEEQPTLLKTHSSRQFHDFAHEFSELGPPPHTHV